MKDQINNPFDVDTSKPVVYMMVGGPGAGKSYTRNLFAPDIPVADCDQWKKEHPDYDPENPGAVHEWSKERLMRQIYRGLGSGETFIYDGTGTNVEKYMRLISDAHLAGFHVRMVYVRTTLRTALQRNRNRERFVPEQIVKEKHATVEESFQVLSGFADSFVVVDGE